jgi:hypothetical protein|nr:MAG: Arc-like DNA binding domain protein [Bacteriophage sp.]
MDNIEMLEKYKQRIKRQNEKIKQDYDRASVTLPKGTKDRIQALGYTVNGFLNAIVLAELEKLEAEAPQATQPAQPEAVKEEQPEQAQPKADAPEDVAELNNWLHQIQEENEQKRLQEVARRQANVEAENGYD